MDRNDAIDECVKKVRKLRRTKVVGPERATARERRLWDRTRYDTFKEVESELLSMKRT